MSYHLLEKKQRKVNQENEVRKFIQAFALQIQLNKCETEFIFINEFSFHHENEISGVGQRRDQKLMLLKNLMTFTCHS